MKQKLRLSLFVISIFFSSVDVLAADNSLLYGVPLPHKVQPSISIIEHALLTRYLNNPNSASAANFLASYHINKTVLFGSYHPNNGKLIKHAILAEYFLNRTLELGGAQKKINKILLKKMKGILNNKLKFSGTPVSNQDIPHEYFIEAFNYREENRYEAIDLLLQEVSQRPENALTSAYLTASNIWVGGEAEFNDPTLLYNFILSSYFSVRTIEMARAMEIEWKIDPSLNERFRLAPLLGGWTVPARRWLAKLHNDTSAITLLDDEHRKWLAINRSFHSASVGLMFFDEEENFAEGLAAWDTGNQHCQEVPSLNACSSQPRFSFNNIAFFAGSVDYFIKAGQLDYAQFYLSFWKNIPPFNYSSWSLGRPAWEFREQNLVQMYDLYNNEDPADDPVHILLKQHKWGPDTITCQLCHQAQDKVWSEEEKNVILLPHESIATINNWPEVSTNWYGSLKDL